MRTLSKLGQSAQQLMVSGRMGSEGVNTYAERRQDIGLPFYFLVSLRK